MKITTLKLTALSLVIALSGCSTMTGKMQSDADLSTATAKSFGLPENQITISNRSDDGMTVSYEVKLKSGKEYSCIRTVGLSVLGVNKSSPLCNPKGQAISKSDNALLRAAGK